MVLVDITTEIVANGDSEIIINLTGTYKKWYHLAESGVNQLWKLSECTVVHCTRAPQTIGRVWTVWNVRKVQATILHNEGSVSRI